MLTKPSGASSGPFGCSSISPIKSSEESQKGAFSHLNVPSVPHDVNLDEVDQKGSFQGLLRGSSFPFFKSIEQTAFKCLQFSDIHTDVITLSKSVDYPGCLHLRVATAFTIPSGLSFSTRQGMELVTKSLVSVGAEIKSASHLAIRCETIDNSSSGSIEAAQDLILKVEKVSNQHGSIISRNGGIQWLAIGMGKFNNTDGTLQAGLGIYLGSHGVYTSELSGSINHSKNFISDHTEIQTYIDRLSIKEGRVEGETLSISGSRFYNRSGMILAKEQIQIDLHEIDPELGNSKLRDPGHQVLVGKIFSENGGVTVATQQPLILASHIKASGLIELISKKQKPFSESDESLSYNESITIKSHRIEKEPTISSDRHVEGVCDAFASNQGSIHIEQVSGQGSIAIESDRGDIVIKKSSWHGQKGALRLIAGKNRRVKLLESTFDNMGKVDVSNWENNYNSELILRFDVTNSHLRGESLKAWAQICTITNSILRFSEIFGVLTLQAFRAEETKLISGNIKIISKGTLLDCKDIKFDSKNHINLIGQNGVLRLKGNARSANNMILSAQKCWLIDLLVHCRGDFYVSGKETYLQDSAFSVNGKLCMLIGRKALIDRNNKFYVSHGQIAKKTDGVSLEDHTAHFSNRYALLADTAIKERSSAWVEDEIYTSSSEIMLNNNSRNAYRIIDRCENFDLKYQNDSASAIYFDCTENFKIKNYKASSRTLQIDCNEGKIKDSRF